MNRQYRVGLSDPRFGNDEWYRYRTNEADGVASGDDALVIELCIIIGAVGSVWWDEFCYWMLFVTWGIRVALLIFSINSASCEGELSVS